MPRTWRRASAVALTAGPSARPKSASWRRGTIQTSNGEREAYGANATLSCILPDEPVRSARLVSDEAAERALAFADHEPSRTTQLLGDAVRDLGQVVEVEAQVVRPRSGLRAPVLDDVEVLGLGVVSGSHQRVPRAADQPLDQVAADRVERAVFTCRCDDRPPRPGRPGLSERHLCSPVAVQLPGLFVGADHVEGEVLEHARADAVAGRPAVGTADTRSSTGSAARAKRSRWNARSTTVATHQLVIGSFRSSNRPLGIDRPQSLDASGAPMAFANAIGKGPGRLLDRVGRRPCLGPAELAGDRRRYDAGHAARVDQLEVSEVDRRH